MQTKINETQTQSPEGEATVGNNLSENKGNNGFFSKIKDFFTANYGYFVIPAFIFIVFGVALKMYGIWPFGTSIIASYDMLAQVCPIIEHFFDVFDGTSGLFHTFHLGGGMDMFGILAYCAVSPFTFILLLAGQGGTVYMVSLVLPLKIACIGISGYIFLRRYFKSIPQYIQVVLAILYACSGYMYVANTYIIWMDLMMYMPLVGAGIIEFSRTKSIKLLAISIAIMIYTCFSIVCFSLLTLFPVLVCMILICKQKAEWREYLSKLCLAMVIAVGVCLPILIPSLVAYMQAGRNTGIFSRVFEIMSESKVKSGELNLHIYEKFTYILTDSTFLVLTVIYFLRCKNKDKRALFLLVALIFLLLPCLVDESMLLLNMGSYYSYALRFGFLSSFYFFYVSAQALTEFLEDKRYDCEINKTKSTVSMVVIAVLSVLGVLFTIGFYNYIMKGKYENDPLILKLFGSDSELHPFKDFYPLFAHSEGGLEATGVLCIVVVLIFAIASVLIRFKFVKFKDVASFLCLVALSQTVFFNASLVYGNRQTGSAQKFDYYKQMVEDIGDEEIYRLKNYDYYISSDSPIIIGNYSHTLFSSMADAKNLTAPKFFKYSGSLTNSTRSNGGGVFSDALLGYKYFVFETGDKSTADAKKYLEYAGVYSHKVPSVKISKTENGSTKTVTWENIDQDKYGQGKWSKLKILISGNNFGAFLDGENVISTSMVSDDIVSVDVVTKNAYGEVKNLVLKDGNGEIIKGEWQPESGFKAEDDRFVSTDNNGKVNFNGEVSNLKSFEGEVLFTEGTASDDYIGLEVSARGETNKISTYRLIIEPNVAYFIYENTLSFPMASVIKAGTLDYDGLNYVEQLQNLCSLLNDGNEVLEKLDLNITDEGNGSFKVKFTCPPDSESYFYHTFPEDYIINDMSTGYKRYTYTTSQTTRSVTVTRANGTLTREEVLENCFAVSLTLSDIEQLKQKLDGDKVDYTLGKNSIKIDNVTAQSGEMLYLNYVNLNGYKAFVNGREVPLMDNGFDFMFLPLDEGENTVEIVYTSPYITFILIGVALAILALAIAWLVYKKKKIIFEKMSIVLPWAAVALAIGLTVFFFIYPTGIYLYKLIFKYIKFMV